jgi:glycosyl transferase family 25
MSMAIESWVMTIDTKSDRFRRFTELNDHLKFEIFEGIHGSKLSFPDSVKQGFLTPDCAASGLVSPGHLGAAISHWTLWWKAVYEQKSLLILEDDVATHRELHSWIDGSDICRDADLVLFGINTDSVLEAISPEGVHQITIFGERHPDYASIGEKLSLTRTSDVRAWKLLKAFGLCCYLVTPKGASKLVEQILPLRLEGVPVPLVDDNVAGIGVDRRLNAVLQNMDAYVSIPFLAWTPNTESNTRIERQII